MIQTSQPILALTTKNLNQNWYFDNIAFYHIFYNIHNLKNATDFQMYILLEGDIIITDGSIIFFNRIVKVWFNFEFHSYFKQIFLLDLRYYSKLYIRLIF